MNLVDHPHIGKASTIARFAAPGQKGGLTAARRVRNYSMVILQVWDSKHADPFSDWSAARYRQGQRGVSGLLFFTCRLLYFMTPTPKKLHMT